MPFLSQFGRKPLKKTAFLLVCWLWSGCFAYNYLHYRPRRIQSDSRPIAHTLWDGLLQRHVSPDGRVDYRGLVADSAARGAYAALLQQHHPNVRYWSREERLAYWINAYNFFTVELVCRHYPVASIKDIERGAVEIPFSNTVWDIEFIEIEGQRYTLNYLEHKILRKEFEEPRIHFAINCASRSCPALRPEAYTAAQLETQLDAQAKLFLADTSKNQLAPDRLQLSKIFSWFKPDFTSRRRDLIDFIQPYVLFAIERRASIDFLPYDWRLNE